MPVYRKCLRSKGYSGTFAKQNKIGAFNAKSNKQLQPTPLILEQAKYDIPGQITNESISNCSSETSQYDDNFLRSREKLNPMNTLHRFVAATPYTANDLIEGLVRFNRRRQRANFTSRKSNSIFRHYNSASMANEFADLGQLGGRTITYVFPNDKSIQTSDSLTHFQKHTFKNLYRKRVVKDISSTEFQKPARIRNPAEYSHTLDASTCTSLTTLHSNEITAKNYSDDVSCRLPRLASYPSGWKDMHVIRAKYGRHSKSIGTTVDEARLESLERDKQKRMSKSDDVLWNRYIVRGKKNHTCALQSSDKSKKSAKDVSPFTKTETSLLNPSNISIGKDKESQLIESSFKVNYVCANDLETKVRNYSAGGQDCYCDETGEENIVYESESDINNSGSQSDEDILSTIKLECNRLTVRCGKQRDRLQVECTPCKGTKRTLNNVKNKKGYYYNTSGLQESVHTNEKIKEQKQSILYAKKNAIPFNGQSDKAFSKSHRAHEFNYQTTDQTNNETNENRQFQRIDVPAKGTFWPNDHTVKKIGQSKSKASPNGHIASAECSTDCSCKSFENINRDRQLSGDRSGNKFEKNTMQYDNLMGSTVTTCCYCGKNGFLEPLPNYEENATSRLNSETRRTDIGVIPDSCIGMCKYPSTWKMHCNESNNKGKVRSICCPYSECPQHNKYVSKTEETYLKSQSLRMSNIEKVSLPPGTSIRNSIRKRESLNKDQECFCDYEIYDDIEKVSLPPCTSIRNSLSKRESLNEDQECFCDYEINDDIEEVKQRDISLKRLNPNLISSTDRSNLGSSSAYRSRNASRSLDRDESTIDNLHRYIGSKCIFDCNCKSVIEPVNRYNNKTMSNDRTHSDRGESPIRYSFRYRVSESSNGNEYNNGNTQNSLVKYGRNNRNEVLRENRSRASSNKYCNNKICRFKGSFARDSKTQYVNKKCQRCDPVNSKHRKGFLNERQISSDFGSSSGHDAVLGRNCDNESCIYRKNKRNKISENSQTDISNSLSSKIKLDERKIELAQLKEIYKNVSATKRNDSYMTNKEDLNDQSRTSFEYPAENTQILYDQTNKSTSLNCDNQTCINKNRNIYKNKNQRCDLIDEQPLTKCDDRSCNARNHPNDEIITLVDDVPDNRSCHDHNCSNKNYKRGQTGNGSDRNWERERLKQDFGNHTSSIKNNPNTDPVYSKHEQPLTKCDDRSCNARNHPNDEIITLVDDVPDNRSCHDHNCSNKNYKRGQTGNGSDRNWERERLKQDFGNHTSSIKNNPNTDPVYSKHRKGFLNERQINSEFGSSSGHDAVLGRNCDNESCIYRKNKRNKISENSQTDISNSLSSKIKLDERKIEQAQLKEIYKNVSATKRNDSYMTNKEDLNDQSRTSFEYPKQKLYDQINKSISLKCDNQTCINKNCNIYKSKNQRGDLIDEQPLIKCDDRSCNSRNHPNDEIINLADDIPDNRSCHDHNCSNKNYKRGQTSNGGDRNWERERLKQDFGNHTSSIKNTPNITKNVGKKNIHNTSASRAKTIHRSEKDTNKSVEKKKPKTKIKRPQISGNRDKSYMQSGVIRNQSEKRSRNYETEMVECCDCDATIENTFCWDKSNKPKLTPYVDSSKSRTSVQDSPYLSCNICSYEVIPVNCFQNDGLSQNNIKVQKHNSPPNQLSCELKTCPFVTNVVENIFNESHCSLLAQKSKSPELCSCDLTTCSNIQTMDKTDYSLKKTENRIEPFDNDVKVIYDSSLKFSKANDVDSFDFICQNRKKPTLRCSISRTFGYNCCDIKPIKKIKEKQSKKTKSKVISNFNALDSETRKEKSEHKFFSSVSRKK